MSTPLGDAIQFFKDFGLFDVVLPFLLVFSLVFALLEKTKVLGTEGDSTRKSLNTMVAFVVGLLVVATNKVVTIINEALPNIVLLLVIVVMFLMLVGTFYKEGSFDFATSHKKWVLGFMIVMLLLIVLIFLNSIPTESGESYLSAAIDSLSGSDGGGDPTIAASVIFAVIALIAIIIVTKKPSSGGKGDDT